jgi:Flp pilus assembly protein TadG
MAGSPPRLRKRLDDSGVATTVSMVLMLPVLTLLLLAGVQAALWNHARTQARVAARATAALVARSGADPVDAERDSEANLTARTDMTNVNVTITVDPAGGTGGIVVVRVTGDAPGMVIGTTSSVDVQVAMPVEGWSSL